MPADLQITSDSDLDVVLEEFKKKQVRRDSTGPKYSCSISGCDATFKRLDHLDRHEFHHTGVKKHSCTYEGCDKIYSILSHLKRHIRSTHERPEAPQKTIKCTLTECDKMFTSHSNMQRHVREAHEAPREYTCPHCSAKFRQKLKLRRHEITQHTKDYPFSCEKCARGFHQQWQQESHQRSCKLYACSECELKFDKWTLFTKHCRETLHGRNRHQCHVCDRVYDKLSELTQHITAKHSSTTEETAAFRCKEPGCKRSYSYERNLRQHMLTVHTGKRFECIAAGCGRCFSSSQNLAKHLLRDHKPSKKRTSTPPVTKRKLVVRKRRRDAGQPARSRLAKLACLTLDKRVDKEVRQRKALALTSVAKEVHNEQLQLEKPQDTVIEELLQQTLQDPEQQESSAA